MNKNISIWRGDTTPPTLNHIWIKEDNFLYLFNGANWERITDKNSAGISDVLLGVGTINSIPEPTEKAVQIDNVLNDIDLNNKCVGKQGDILLQSRINIGNFKDVNPCIEPSHNKQVNIVFKKGEYELGVNPEGKVRTTLRQCSPVWKLIKDEDYYIIKHIENSKYLSYSNFEFVLSTTAERFNIIYNEDDQSYEICRIDDDSQSMNMQSGNGYDYKLSLYIKGDQHNKLYFVDSQLYNLPIFSEQYNSIPYKINFKTDPEYYYYLNEDNIIVNKNNSDFYLLGSYNKFEIRCESKYVGLSSSELKILNTPQYFTLIPSGLDSNQYFEIYPYNNIDSALNPYRGVSDNNIISIYNRLDFCNLITFKSNEDQVIKKFISTNIATDNYDGLMSSDDKIKLDKLCVHRKKYEYENLQNISNDAWYLLAEIEDQECSIFQVSTFGHNDVIFTVSTGWTGAQYNQLDGSLTILNSFITGNNPDYSHIKGVRLRKLYNQDNVRVEIQLDDPYGRVYTSIRVTAFSNAETDKFLKNDLVGNTDMNNIIQSYALKQNSMMCKNMYVDSLYLDNTSLTKTRLTNIETQTGKISTLENSIKNLQDSINNQSAATSENIIIAGGPLADNVEDNWPEEWEQDGNRIIPRGTSLQSLLEGLFLKTQNGTVSWEDITWNPLLDAPTVTLSSNGPVEVGSTVTCTVISNSNITGNTRSATCTTSQGYFDTVDGSYNSGNKTVSKTGSSSGSVVLTYTWNDATVSNFISETTALKIKSGTNTFVASQSGITASVDALPETTIYASTNTKKVLNNVSATLTDTKPNDIPLSSSNNDTITGYYRWNAFVADSTDITATASSWKFVNAKTVSSVTAADQKYIIVMVPSGYSLTGAKQMGLDFTGSFATKDVDLIIGGGDTYAYKMYYWQNTSGSDAKVENITIS